jgi:hypothetical protein
MGLEDRAMNDVMHIYGQPLFHDEAYIVMDRSSLREMLSELERLNAAICRADDERKDVQVMVGRVSAFVQDGEGYNTYLILLDEKTPIGQWNKLQAPYRSKLAEEMGLYEGTHPYELIPLVRCVKNGGYELEIKVGKIYKRLVHTGSGVRVENELLHSHVYPESFFEEDTKKT